MTGRTQLRVLNTLFFLVAVNWTAGALAVEFRYPSLWGRSDVFVEYAYPLPLSWALAHLATMIPLAWATWRSWDWEPSQVLRLRIGLLLGLIASASLDLIYGGGRWHRIPFILFPLVDLGWALTLSLLLTRWARRAAVSGALAVGVVFALWPSVSAHLHERATKEAFERVASEDGRVRALSVTGVGNSTFYAVEVAIGSEDALTDSMCLDVLHVYERMLALHDPGDTDSIARIVRPREDVPFARAVYSSRGRWECTLADTPARAKPSSR